MNEPLGRTMNRSEVETETRELDVVQQWFQHVVTSPAGPDAATQDDDAQRLIRMGRDELESVITRSKTLTAAERIGVYANAYYARLLECLGESFPVLRRTIGEEAFNDFAFDYLQNYPSRSYTLGKLGDRFAEFLEETRPDRDDAGNVTEVGFPDLLIDLVRLERTIEEVFDGPGFERERALEPGDLADVPPERFADCRLVPVVCLRLLRFTHSVNPYYTEARRSDDDAAIPLPEPTPERAAITRRDYIVRRLVLDETQYTLLDALCRGETIGAALAQASAAFDGDDPTLASNVRQWFGQWAAQRLFARIEVPA